MRYVLIANPAQLLHIVVRLVFIKLVEVNELSNVLGHRLPLHLLGFVLPDVVDQLNIEGERPDDKVCRYVDRVVHHLILFDRPP